jgi:hypothetical protein
MAPTASAAEAMARRSGAGSAVPVGLLGDVRTTIDGRRERDDLDRARDVDPVVGQPWECLVAGEGVARVLRVHRVRGVEGDGQPAGTPEREEQVVHDLVRAVRGPHLLDGHTHPRLPRDVVGERRPEGVRVPIRVAVQACCGVGHGRAHGCGDVRRQREGVLVDVEPRGHVELGSAVGDRPGQVVADRRSEDRVHVSRSGRRGP